mmetsp:Transcript_129066/g.288484  ORF Transcript_129066/g.288484 Transcript_129066/m.288484 type:complete len:478 (+) Transcript_129066:87-1520(+)
MIEYVFGSWGIGFIFQFTGSVFPKAILWAFPSAVIAFVVSECFQMEKEFATGWYQVWAGFSSVLAFLIVFRNNQAYSRFWEGATLIQQVRGEWFNAVSSVFAFMSSREGPKATPEHIQRMDNFQELLIKLMSLLYAGALHQVSCSSSLSAEIIDPGGIPQSHLDFLVHANDPCEVIMQWIQKLLMNANKDQIIDAPPPILSRSFQELSRGIVNLNNARKIADIPFPFPYAQMIQVFLLVHWVATPLFAAMCIETALYAGLVTLIVESGLWSLTYIAAEIDQPFGNDWNDLDVDELQKDFNRSLFALLDPIVQHPPSYNQPDMFAFQKKRTSVWAPQGRPSVVGIDKADGEDAAEPKACKQSWSARLCHKKNRPKKVAARPDSTPPGAVGMGSTNEMRSIGSPRSQSSEASKEAHRLKSGSGGPDSRGALSSEGSQNPPKGAPQAFQEGDQQKSSLAREPPPPPPDVNLLALHTVDVL